MKILAVADIHGDQELVKALAKRAEDEDVDLVILAGDITFWEQKLEGLIGPFKEVNKKVVLVPGNHETVATTEFLAKLYQPETYSLHGYSMKVGDIGLIGCGGAKIGMFKVDDEQVFNMLKKADADLQDVREKIMVLHMPPHNTKLDLLGEYNVGSHGVRGAIEAIKPKLVICGHIHETGGLEDHIGDTKVVNVATDTGTIIEI